MTRVSDHRLLYFMFFLVAVIISYVLSQFGLFATIVEAAVLISGVLAWRKKRPQDFAIASCWPRVMISLMWTFVFLASYLIVRTLQPTNTSVYSLAAMAIVCSLLAIYFGFFSRKRFYS